MFPGVTAARISRRPPAARALLAASLMIDAIRIARSRSSSGYFLGATMTLILSGIESLHQTRHETVPVGAPFRLEIEWLASTGITTGWPDGTFHPSANVERQAMAAFLHRFDTWQDE